jgi:hypothetical protein
MIGWLAYLHLLPVRVRFHRSWGSLPSVEAALFDEEQSKASFEWDGPSQTNGPATAHMRSGDTHLVGGWDRADEELGILQNTGRANHPFKGSSFGQALVLRGELQVAQSRSQLGLFVWKGTLHVAASLCQAWLWLGQQRADHPSWTLARVGVQLERR